MCLQKFLGTFDLVVFVVGYQRIPPEDVYCNVDVAGVRKELSSQSGSFVVLTRVIEARKNV